MRHISAFVVLALLALGAALMADASLGGSTPSAKIENPKYEVVFVEHPPAGTALGESSREKAHAQHGDRWVPMKLPNGSRFDCLLPDESALGEKVQEKKKTPVGEKVPAQVADRINAILRGSCAVKLAGWWVYELCWGTGLRQFHQSPQQVIETEYYLGKGPALSPKDVSPDLFYGENPVHGIYVTTTYLQGTKCDLTGKPRVAEIRAQCGTNAEEATELEVVEPETCRYVATLTHKSLCREEGLRKEDEAALQIQCFPQVAPSGGI